jgi:hypothetical protein
LSRQTRIIRYGGSILLVLVGVGCGALIRGSTGGTLATVFVGIGLVGLVSLVFYEVGLTEDRERDRERADRPPLPEARPPDAPQVPQAPHPPGDASRLRPPDRMRGRRRRLR